MSSITFIFKTLIKVPCIIFVAFFIMNCFAFMFIYFKVLGFSYVLMQEAVENNYIPPRQAGQIAQYLLNLKTEIPMCQDATIIVGVDSGNAVLWDDTTYTPGGAADLTAIRGGYRIGNRTYASTMSANDNAGHRVQYGKSKTVGIHCEYEFVWPLSYQYTHGNKNVDGYTGVINGANHDAAAETGAGAYNINNDPYTLNNLGEYTTTAGRTEAKDSKKGVIIPIDIYYTVPGLKYYADL